MVVSLHAVEMEVPAMDGCSERAWETNDATLTISSLSEAASATGIATFKREDAAAFPRPCLIAAAACRASKSAREELIESAAILVHHLERGPFTPLTLVQ